MQTIACVGGGGNARTVTGSGIIVSNMVGNPLEALLVWIMLDYLTYFFYFSMILISHRDWFQYGLTTIYSRSATMKTLKLYFNVIGVLLTVTLTQSQTITSKATGGSWTDVNLPS